MNDTGHSNLFGKMSLGIIAIAGILLIATLIQLDDAKYTVRETSAYTRVSNCIDSKVANPPTTQEDVEKCYAQVEKDSGINLERFDFQ